MQIIRNLIGQLVERFHLCASRSPEGWICTRHQSHKGLHVDWRGQGYAWGGDHE